MPVQDQQQLFEHLSLEGFQAGLSWITILKRRPGFRSAFEDFNIQKVAEFDDSRVEALMQDTGIIRNRLKIQAVIHNARTVLERNLDLATEFWRFAPPQSITSTENFAWKVTTPESNALSKHLKTLGLKVVGSTSMYAMMQSIGMVSDHAPMCYRRSEAQSALWVSQ